MERLKKVNLSEAVYKKLLAMINKGNLKPGDKLPSKPELCNLLGRSQRTKESKRILAILLAPLREK
jgi:DNA-binding FadR family transcriptional regulator